MTNIKLHDIMFYTIQKIKTAKGDFKMEKQKIKIMRFSKVIYIFLKIAYVVLIAVGISYIFAWLLSIANLNTEIITVGGVEREVPILFKLGETRVFLPVIWKSGFDLQANFELFGKRSIPVVGLGDIVLVIFTIIGIGYAKIVFKLLRENGSPFRDDVVKALKKLAVALLLVGAVSGAIPFLAAGIVWVLCLIFDYGCLLQNESDTTL